MALTLATIESAEGDTIELTIERREGRDGEVAYAILGDGEDTDVADATFTDAINAIRASWDTQTWHLVWLVDYRDVTEEEAL